MFPLRAKDIEVEPYSGETTPHHHHARTGVCLLVMCSYCFSGATALTYRKTKTGLQPCIFKSHGEIIGEAKVVNKPIGGVVQA